MSITTRLDSATEQTTRTWEVQVSSEHTDECAVPSFPGFNEPFVADSLRIDVITNPDQPAILTVSALGRTERNGSTYVMFSAPDYVRAVNLADAPDWIVAVLKDILPTEFHHLLVPPVVIGTAVEYTSHNAATNGRWDIRIMASDRALVTIGTDRTDGGVVVEDIAFALIDNILVVTASGSPVRGDTVRAVMHWVRGKDHTPDASFDHACPEWVKAAIREAIPAEFHHYLEKP